MPAYINISYKMPKRRREKKEQYFLRVMEDVREVLTTMESHKEPLTLEDTLDIIKKGEYIFIHPINEIPIRINLSKVRQSTKEYTKKDIEDIIEKCGQLL